MYYNRLFSYFAMLYDLSFLWNMQTILKLYKFKNTNEMGLLGC